MDIRQNFIVFLQQTSEEALQNIDNLSGHPTKGKHINFMLYYEQVVHLFVHLQNEQHWTGMENIPYTVDICRQLWASAEEMCMINTKD